MGDTPSFDSKGGYNLAKVPNYLAEKPAMSSLVNIEMDGPGQRDISNLKTSRWRITTSAPFVQIPWGWFAVLSGTLLKPRTRSISARLVPGICPFDGMFNNSRTSIVASKLRSIAEVRDTDTLVHREDSSNSLLFGIIQLSYSNFVYQQKGPNPSVDFSRVEVNNYENVPDVSFLEIAITLSIVLGVLVSCFIAQTAYIFKDTAIKIWKEKKEEKKRYSKLEKTRTKPDKLSGIQKLRNQLLFIPKTPHPYSYPE